MPAHHCCGLSWERSGLKAPRIQLRVNYWQVTAPAMASTSPQKTAVAMMISLAASATTTYDHMFDMSDRAIRCTLHQRNPVVMDGHHHRTTPICQ